MTLDLAIGETSNIESEDKGKIQDIVQKVRDLNGRLQDIRREQVFQRVSASPFFVLQWDIGQWSQNVRKMLTRLRRNGKPSLEINPSPLTLELYDGASFRWWF